MNFLKFSSVGGTPTKVSNLSLISVYLPAKSRVGKDEQASSAQKRADRVDADLILAVFGC